MTSKGAYELQPLVATQSDGKSLMLAQDIASVETAIGKVKIDSSFPAGLTFRVTFPTKPGEPRGANVFSFNVHDAILKLIEEIVEDRK